MILGMMVMLKMVFVMDKVNMKVLKMGLNIKEIGLME
jgi:hypothetical protein